MKSVKTRKERCGGSSISEFTLCGDSFDIGYDEPELGNPRFAQPGQSITCQDCLSVLNYILNNYRYSYSNDSVKWSVKKP